MKDNEGVYVKLDHISNEKESQKFHEAVLVLKSLLESEDIYVVEKAFAIATAQKYYSDYLKLNNVTPVPPEKYHSFAKKLFKNFDEDIYHTQSPPGNEHSTIFKNGKDPKVFLEQPYTINHESLKAKLKFCEENDLKMKISNGASFWFPSQTLTVEYKKNE